MDRASLRIHTPALAATATATAIAIIPDILPAQEFIWDTTPDAAVVGGSGVLDENGAPNFQSPTGVPNQTFPGNAALAFIALGPGANNVTVEGNVSVTGLRFEVSGYNLWQGPSGRLVSATPGVNLTLSNGAEVEISVEMDGSFAVAGNGTLTLAGTQSDLLDLQVNGGATLDAFATNANALTNFGTVVNSGSFGILNNQGNFTNTVGGVIRGNATNSGGTMALAGTFGADLTNNAGIVRTNGDLSVGGDFLNRDFTDLSGGNMIVAGDVINSATLIVRPEYQLIGNTINEMGASLRLDGDLVGNLRLESGSDTLLRANIDGNVTNNGNIDVGLESAITGDLINNGTVDLAGFTTTRDVLNIGGDVSGTGTYTLNLDLRDEGAADTIVVGGTTTGTVNLSFDVVGTGSVATQQSILVFDVNDAAANSFTFSAAGLPPNDGISVYSVVQDGANGDLFVVGQVNPGVGSVGGNLVLTQSLIGAIVNRPTSPFVVGLAYDDPDPCGAGAWSRLQAGRADASPGSDNGVSQLQSTVSADYTGFQAGGDFACFRGPDGWDLAIGAIGGINDGQIEQPVFAIDPLDPTALSDMLTSITTTDFMQRYAGVYGTASTGQWSADLQFRLEQTDFDITNEGVNGMDGIGVEDAELTSDARTLSGAVNYAYAIPDTAFALIPTAGVAITRGTSGSVDFEDGSRLDIGDFASDVGFVGVTGAWSRIDDDSQGALRAFVTSTYYNDFSDPIASVFTTPTDETAEVENETLGSYGEVSIGASYVRLAPVDSFAGVKQYVASLRADARFGDQIDSWGLVGQVRVQF